jgi:hypothetical protein
MLGHLVVGRYGVNSGEQSSPAQDAGWVSRLFRALLRKKP